MIVSLIVAVAKNNVIGKDNTLIWHLPADMQHFKTTTSGHHIITGRKNYISIPAKFRPLPNRTNIVLTRDKNFQEPNIHIAHHLEDAIQIAKKNGETEVFIIGGGQLYKESLEKNLIDKMYITHIHHEFEGDTFFPTIDFNQWNTIQKTDFSKDEKNLFDYSIGIYQKK
jgi:dihydrofolate reductase